MNERCDFSLTLCVAYAHCRYINKVSVACKYNLNGKKEESNSVLTFQTMQKMTSNETALHNFYTAFQNKDFLTMQQCYADDATFSDPVFENINANQVRKMWEMFCVKSTDIKIEYSNVVADENSGSANWKATYSFSLTGNKVINHISAKFIFRNGKIISHTDTFSFYNWAKQALGIKGFLLGWTPLVKRKVQLNAMKSLEKFISQKK